MNMQRRAPLVRLVRAFQDASTGRAVQGGPSGAAAQRMCAALGQNAGAPGNGLPHMLPACRFLDAAFDHARGGPAALGALADALQELAPLLHWRRRTGLAAADPAFEHGHANTQIIGPDGIEHRSDVILGASLLAPHVAYPWHDHPPEEIYLVMSEGDWFTEASGWYTPGIGGIVHHPSGLTHAMRSGAKPLLAVWCLWTGR